MKKISRALLSVSDKTGIVDFARSLCDLGIEILSTGGTARAIREGGVPVKDISEFTGFPEILDGRVKTLHPNVHAGLLFLRDNDEHVETMTAHDLEAIDLVCVNLYPFEQVVAKPNGSFKDAIENIDIGGPTMLRSAAKNMKFVTVVTEPSDYARVLDSIRINNGHTTLELRIELSQKVFARVASYNTAIAAYLSAQTGSTQPFSVAYSKGKALRYGENPHQQATFYSDREVNEACIAHCEVLHGKEMSFNNYVDGDAALEAVKELSGQPAVTIVKHTNPCGCATGDSLDKAFEAAWAGDSVSAFGSVIAVTETVDLATAKCLKNRFVEVLIAPDYEPDALNFLSSKSKQLRILKLHKPISPAGTGLAIRQINGGLLVQDRDLDTVKMLDCPTKISFPDTLHGLVDFGVRVCKHVKSNAILIVRQYAPGAYAVLGMGAGQPNRVDAVRKLALTKALENIEGLYSQLNPKGTLEDFSQEILGESVLISDAFFPFPDNIHTAAEAGIRYVVEPGGSKRDDEVTSACDEHGIAMMFTGMRHFRH